MVNQLETLMTSIDVRDAILNNDYSKLNKDKTKALQLLLPQVAHIYKRFKNLGKEVGNIPEEEVTLEERIRSAVRKAFLKPHRRSKK